MKNKEQKKFEEGCKNMVRDFVNKIDLRFVNIDYPETKRKKTRKVIITITGFIEMPQNIF